MQQDTWTSGPFERIGQIKYANELLSLTSFPSDRPDATARARPTALISKVHPDRNLSKTYPRRI